MQRRPTRADVALTAGVSKTTVTYVLNDREDISIPEATRERVRAAAEKLGYRPHMAAQVLASGRTHTVTIVFPVRIWAHDAHVLRAFERQSGAFGYHVMASTVGHRSISDVRPDLWSLLTGLTDGLILVDMPGAFAPMITEMLPANKPVVSMGCFTVPGTDSVRVDLGPGSLAAMEHLLSGSTGRIAFFVPGIPSCAGVLTSSAWETNVDPREPAYTHTMEQAGRPIEKIPGSTCDRRASMLAISDHVRQHGCPDAIFCYNDEMAISAHRALRELGFRIPEDVRLVGCDGSEESEFQNPPLSTIVQPVDRMCALAWKLLMDRLEDPGRLRQEVTIASELAIRASSQR